MRYRSSPRWRRFLRLEEENERKRSDSSESSRRRRGYSLKSIDSILRVVHDDGIGDEERLVGVGSSKSVEGKASRETGDGSEERLEGLGEMMRDVVLVDLRKRKEGLSQKTKKEKSSRPREGRGRDEPASSS